MTPHPEAVKAATEIEGEGFDELIANHATIITRHYSQRIADLEGKLKRAQEATKYLGRWAKEAGHAYVPDNVAKAIEEVGR